MKFYPLTILLCLIFSLAVCAQELSTDDYFIEGVREFCAGDTVTAEKMLLQAAESDRDNDAAYYYLSVIAKNRGERDLATAYLRKAMALNPGNTWYRLTSARFCVQSGETETAIGIYEDLVREFPSRISVYYEMIDVYTRNGQIGEALGALDKIEAVKGRDEYTGSLRYELLAMQGKYDEAVELLKEMDAEYPSPRTAFILGDIHKNKFEDSTAMAYYAKALSIDPSYAPAYLGMAEVHRAKREFSDFFRDIGTFMSAPDMNPQMKLDYMQEIVLTPGVIQAFMPQVDTLVAGMLSAHPEDSLVKFMAGAYYIQTGRTEQGKELYRENLAMYPESRSANTEYIYLLYYLQLEDELIEACTEALKAFPADSSIMEIRAVAWWKKGMPEKAIEEYLGIAGILSEDSPMLLNCYTCLGDLYYEIGNPSKCFRFYDKALKIDGSYTPLLNNYAYYLSMEGKKLKKALAMSLKTVEAEPDNPTYLDTYGWLLYLTGDYEGAKAKFKHAMLYGGRDSAVILDHYGDVLFALGEYDLAFLYWEDAHAADSSLGIDRKITEKKDILQKMKK